MLCPPSRRQLQPTWAVSGWGLAALGGTRGLCHRALGRISPGLSAGSMLPFPAASPGMWESAWLLRVSLAGQAVPLPLLPPSGHELVFMARISAALLPQGPSPLPSHGPGSIHSCQGGDG